VTRVQVQLQRAAVGCRQDAELTLSDGTPAGTTKLLLKSAATDSGALALDVPGGATLVLSIDAEARECRAHPADANIVVQYKTR
jgi:hypothetical protein